MSRTQTEELLLGHIKTRALLRGDFTLASGKKSDYYIDSKRAIYSGHVVDALTEVLWERTKRHNLDAVGGLEIGAIPLTAYLVAKSARNGWILEGFVVRKQTKDHGSKRKIEGNLEAGMRVAILDDVLTTGTSALQAVKAVEEVGAKVVLVTCLVDRNEGATATLAGYPYHPIFTVDDLTTLP